MSDLKVDYQLLESTYARLISLSNELSSIEMTQSEFDAAMGSSAVASAMSNFAGNWTYHREHLIANMRNLATMASEVVQKFKSADGHLGEALTGK